MPDSTTPLRDLHADFLATSTRSMPVAGMVFWGVVGAASLRLSAASVAYVVLFGSGMIFPLALLIDRLTGQNRIRRSNTGNPLTRLFLRAIVMVVLLWPLAIIAARLAGNPNLVVLGGAILMGIIWIPYGWAADDPTGLEHAVGRSIASYAAFLLAPAPYVATAISVAVLLSYLYSMIRMKRAPAGA
jgi:hypothetical protein